MGRAAIANPGIANQLAGQPATPALRVITTPADEVDAVCRLALATLLTTSDDLPAEALECVLHARSLTMSDRRTDEKNAEAWATLHRKLLGLRVVDPACGEGHFLVGMLDVLDEVLGLVERRLGYPPDPVRRRTHILRQSLYGVDVQHAPLERAGERLNVGAHPTPHAHRPSANLVCCDALVTVDDNPFQAAFPEISTRGFDLVVGNPPFLRHEAIVDPVGALGTSAYKRRLRTATYRRWPDFFGWDERTQHATRPLNGRSDLCVPFVLLAASLLAEHGATGMVVPAALFQAGYAQVLRDFLAASPWECWLGQTPGRGSPIRARVNTALLVFSRAKRSEDRARGLREVELSAVTPATSWTESRPATRNPIRTAAQSVEKLTGVTKLSSICRLRYPIKTGLNAFFYLSTTVRENFGIEPEFCRPVVKSPRQVISLSLSAATCATTAFVCDLDERRLAERCCTGALAYIDWGRRQRTPDGTPWPEVQSLRGRDPWYRLPLPTPAVLLCPRFFDRRIFFAVPETGLLEDQTFYGLVAPCATTDEINLLGAILNSSITALALESGGRTGLGDGARQYTLGDLATLPVLSPNLVRADIAAKVCRVFAQLAKRPILSVAAELEQADRQALDELIAVAAGLSAHEMQRVRGLLAASVEQRLERAQQARRGRSTLSE